uniref:BTB domain-containing protein n=1 Tax=Panagrolaimus sp. ES5 TaxID=591445 RepID=A0AC34FLM7_9BILA
MKCIVFIYFVSFFDEKVPAHRCILSSFSDIFAAIFDQNDSDGIVEVEVDFSEATLTRALEYCYGKMDFIKNFEEELIKFSCKYGIKGLKKACLKSLKDNHRLTNENICDITKIAFDQDYTLLKQKCLKYIVENKDEIGAEKLSQLPLEILVSTILTF